MATSVCSPSYEEEILPELEGELEDEVSLHEEEGEGEEEISPIRKIYPDAVMEHLGELAAESESEEEAAEHFLPLIGMAASKLLPVVDKAVAPAARKALPKIARTVTRVTPRLTKSVGNLARKLHRNPTTRPLLRAVPAIARRTVHSIARQVAHNKPITARSAIRTLARQTARVLGHRGHRRHALRRHHHLDRRFHWRHGRGMVRPHGYRGSGVPGYSTGGGRTVTHTGHGGGTVHKTSGGGATVHVPGGGAVRPGRIVNGQCMCSAGPSYCRCCGQVLR